MSTEEVTVTEVETDSEHLVMYFTIDKGNRLEGLSSSPMLNSIEVTLPKDSEVLFNPFIYRYEDGELIRDSEFQLSKVKERKIAELNRKCQKEIEGKFKATVNNIEYEFSFDIEAQQNFTGTMLLFAEGMLDSAEWTAWIGNDVKRISLTKADFIRIVTLGFEHKNECIRKFRNVLQPRVEACSTIEEVNQIEG